MPKYKRICNVNILQRALSHIIKEYKRDGNLRCPECQRILADDKCMKCMIKIKITRIQKTEYD